MKLMLTMHVQVSPEARGNAGPGDLQTPFSIFPLLRATKKSTSRQARMGFMAEETSEGVSMRRDIRWRRKFNESLNDCHEIFRASARLSRKRRC